MKNMHPQLRRCLIQVLTLAFEKNNSVRMVTGHGADAQLKRSRLMRYALWRCERFGKVVSCGRGKAFALVLFPDQIRFSFITLLRDLQLIFGVIGIFKLLKVLRKEQLLERLRPEGKLYYLWFIGVSPPDQGKGYGSELLEELCADAAALGRVICLETSVERNLPWYQAHGFELYQTLLAGSYPLYMLRRA